MEDKTRNLIIALSVFAVSATNVVERLRSRNASPPPTAGANATTQVTTTVNGSTIEVGSGGGSSQRIPDATPRGDQSDRARDLLALVSDVLGSLDEDGKTVGHELERQLLPALTSDEQAQLGRAVHAEAVKRIELVRTGERAELVRSIGADVVRGFESAGVGVRGLEYTFTLVDSEIPNAFAHVGGYIYVNSGLLDVLETVGQLRFVLAHEVGHVALGHTDMVFAAQKAAGQLGNPAGVSAARLLYAALAMNYSSVKELEADRIGFVVATRQGVSAEVIIRSFLVLEEAETDAHSKGSTRADSRGRGSESTHDETGIAAVLKDHFRSHPSSVRRITQIRELESRSAT